MADLLHSHLAAHVEVTTGICPFCLLSSRAGVICTKRNDLSLCCYVCHRVSSPLDGLATDFVGFDRPFKDFLAALISNRIDDATGSLIRMQVMEFSGYWLLKGQNLGLTLLAPSSLPGVRDEFAAAGSSREKPKNYTPTIEGIPDLAQMLMSKLRDWSFHCVGEQKDKKDSGTLLFVRGKVTAPAATISQFPAYFGMAAELSFPIRPVELARD